MTADDPDDDFHLDDDDLEGDDLSDEAGGELGDDFDDDDFDDDFDFDDDDDFDEGGKKRDVKKIAMIAAGAVLGVGILGGAGWYFLSGDDAEMAEAETPVASGEQPQQRRQASAVLSLGAVTGGSQSPGGLTPPPSRQAAPLVSAPQLGPTVVTGGQNAPAPAADPDMLAPATTKGVGVMVPAVSSAGFSESLGTPPQVQGLAAVNDPGLMEQTNTGVLPRISPAGQQPWQAYARPFSLSDDRPKVAVVMSGLGLSQTVTEMAIAHLPPEITLSFSPYAPGLSDWIARARAAGHEVMLDLPLEPDSFPVDDPGPLALRVNKPVQDNLRLLDMMMSQGNSYTGFLTDHGSLFTRQDKAIRPILEELKVRGLLFADRRTSEGSIATTLATELQVPRLFVNEDLNSNPSRAGMEASLQRLLEVAGSRAHALGVVDPTPASIETIKVWAATLRGGNILLAPASALANKQFLG